MFRIFVLLAAVLLGLAIAGPVIRRSKKDIEEFSNYLDRIMKGNGPRAQNLTRTTSQLEMANTEELSGRYQGDIVLDDIDYESILMEYSFGRSAYTTTSITTWPDKTVIFAFGAGEFDTRQQEAIWAAIRDIEANTCVKFRYRQTESVYALLTGASDGCYAHIGHRVSRGAHTLNLARNTVGYGCFRHVTIVHEFMHILGFTHMHSTFDRDNYVAIVQENILSGCEHNFDIYTANQVNNYGIPYDYVSCLHYGPTSYSRNGAPTMIAKQRFQGEMGQRDIVTSSDWLRINRHYNCPGAWD